VSAPQYHETLLSLLYPTVQDKKYKPLKDKV
jgi:hypothetical protein